MRQAAIALFLALASPAGAAVGLLESDAGHAVLEVVPEPAEVRTVGTSERDYVTIEIPGFGWLDETGRPEARVEVPCTGKADARCENNGRHQARASRRTKRLQHGILLRSRVPRRPLVTCF